MTNRRPLLVATDLSARDDRAVDRALMLATEWGVRVGVVHVLAPDSAGEGKEAMAALVRDSLPDPAADVDILLPQGSAPATIAATAQDYGAGLIVTGVARFNHVGDYFLGTAVDHIVRHAAAPVLIVRRRPHAPYRRLMVASDFSAASLQALVEAGRLFPQAELHLVHACPLSFAGRIAEESVRREVLAEAQEDMDAFLAHPALPAEVRARVRPHVAAGETARVVAEALTRERPDLFVVGTHGGGGLRQATLGSVAAELLVRVPVDTLVVRQHG